MKPYYITIFFLALIQPQVGWLLLPAFPVALAASKKDAGEEVFVLAFLAGILVDLFTGTVLGPASVFLLFEAFLIGRLGGQLRNSVRLTVVVALILGIIFQAIFRDWLRI